MAKGDAMNIVTIKLLKSSSTAKSITTIEYEIGKKWIIDTYLSVFKLN